MDKREALVPGRVLWLRSKRPQNVPVEIKPVITLPKEEPKEVERDSVKVIKEEFSVKDIVESPDAPGRHVVKAGETLYGISKVYAVAVDSIKIWNRLASNEIKLGQELIIKNKMPVVSVLQTEYIEHFVQQGETLFAISRKYDVSVADIQKWNNKPDPSVSIGEKLLIRKK
ncbi:MAG: LysM peptidoglycan-binding domain-containing protein [Cytophagaceae bacterium]|nr:LysM peptidoglycan-binding domain-containing protein [Cytophagaceae bacterium]